MHSAAHGFQRALTTCSTLVLQHILSARSPMMRLLLLMLPSLLCAASEPLLTPSRDGYVCPLGQFPCGNLSICLPQALHCNGMDDCENGADEENCVDTTGWLGVLGDMLAGNSGTVAEDEADTCSLELFPGRCRCWGRAVDCTAQDLSAVPRVSLNVTQLDLKINKIRSLLDNQFAGYQGLRKLFLQKNKIRVISPKAFAGLFQLKMLFLSHNRIARLLPRTFEDLHRLEWLMLDNNRIARIAPATFLGLRSLYFLYMLNNSLVKIPDGSFCAETPKLSWLELEGNRIRAVRGAVFQQCRELTVLILRRNRLRWIQSGTFSGLSRLVELDLSLNGLDELRPSLFHGLVALQQLNISYNPLKEICPRHFESLPQLLSLSLEGLEIPNIHNVTFRGLANLSHIYFKKFQYCSSAPHVRSCKPNTDGISSFEHLLASIILRVFVWVIACVTCLGNLCVICMRSCVVAESSAHTMAIKSLCLPCLPPGADGLMGIYLFVIGAFDLKYSGEYNRHAQGWMASMPCQLVGSLATLSSEVSVLLLTYMTLEKYFSIVFPFSHRRAGRKQTASVLAAIWLLGLSLSVVPLCCKESFGNYYGRNGVCFPLQSELGERPSARGFSTTIYLGLNLAAFITIVFAYTGMFYSIRITACRTAQSSVCPRDVAIAKRFFFIVFTDALCWIPIFLLKLLSLLQVEIPDGIAPLYCVGRSPVGEAGCLMAFPGWSRHHHILGGHLHPAHQQRTQPHPLHHHHGSLPGEGEGPPACPAPRAELPAELHAGGAVGRQRQPLTLPGSVRPQHTGHSLHSSAPEAGSRLRSGWAAFCDPEM
ncbi:relaxin receptor 1-like isoform X3 [Numida meleagris]|uniref:relaxin receptor 1-like isoform X3 n=1 Tax=Numida meleagris TaxID=8996 RepID=UPI000B3DD521|nr:relaxin receptor 1-like isoform X3 [Numida meleagris]